MTIDIKAATVTDLQNERAGLFVKLENQNGTVSRLSGELSAAQVAVRSLTGVIAGIDAELERRLRPAIEPRISDHALLRFVERIMSVDIETLRASVLTPAVVAAIRAGASAVTVDGVKFVVKDGVIVTTLGEDQRLKRRTRKNEHKIDDAGSLKAGLAEYYAQESDDSEVEPQLRSPS